MLLVLATCFYNDIYREASKRNVTVSNVEVVCTGEFGAEEEPGSKFTYKANVIADAPASEIDDLNRHTDQVAEIHLAAFIQFSALCSCPQLYGGRPFADIWAADNKIVHY